MKGHLCFITKNFVKGTVLLNKILLMDPEALILPGSTSTSPLFILSYIIILSRSSVDSKIVLCFSPLSQKIFIKATHFTARKCAAMERSSLRSALRDPPFLNKISSS